MTRCLIALFRATRLALHIARGLTLALAYPWLKPRLQRRIVQGWSAGLLCILNVRAEITEGALLHGMRGGLIVANHVSWLDVFILNAILPMRFVAKSEVRSWPVIGWLCARAQTLFIERGRARAAARVNAQMAGLLQQGGCLAVFPEGTTTDGTSVAHFHSSLLQAAVDSAVAVFPVAIRYQDERGAHCTLAAYIGSMSLGRSLWNILCAPALQVRLTATPPLASEGASRRDLALTARQRIRCALDSLQAARPTEAHKAAHRHSSDVPRSQSLYGALLYPGPTREASQRQTEQGHQSFIWF